MTSNDVIRLAYFDDCLERGRREEEANGHAKLEAQMLPKQSEQFRVFNNHFKQALNTALHSLVLLASVMHQAQNSAHGAVTKETGIILTTLNKYFRSDWAVVTTAPTIALLRRIAIGALKEYHGISQENRSDHIVNIAPLNYQYFLLKWFSRAVVLMISGTINIAAACSGLPRCASMVNLALPK
ncbi:hypothetical protein AC579_8682 [Pseudocercospora musae]|uniref:Uncharacterized protein n=1 Tax=Pseudocercospora musae TaxID=113226 RepID=A0A139I0G1_9PEZI|nr:hypothetical protein AC579_8682 [Pseudocercospora musae]